MIRGKQNRVIFPKIRNTINVALGTQKARGNPSEQAIEKWEEDLHYIDAELSPQLGDQT